ncbi:MAG: PQQ-dependent sugar dehydrogenase, partial [Methylococcaceae bacterium]
VITQGGNYGWPYVTYGTKYFSYQPYLDAAEFKEKTIDPIFAWVPSIGVTSLFESNRFDPRWNGDIIVGSLKAQSLFRLKMIDNRVIFSEPIWIGHRMRDMAEQDGCIIIWTDDGSLIFITPERDLLAADQLSIEKGYQKSFESALRPCSTCHSYASHNQFYWAPTLAGIYGAKIASDDYQNYSTALKNKIGIWDERTLTAFLFDPQRFAPGTTMINPDLTGYQIAETVKALKSLSHGGLIEESIPTQIKKTSGDF